MSLKVPNPIRHIFEPHPIFSDNIVLDTESGRRPKAGTVQVRALDGFLFVKNGRFVYPTFDKPEEWWTGVVAYGYAAALTGEYRYFIWAGQWDQDYEGKHIEVVRLENLVGIYKESHVHWRNGVEATLWLETSQGKSYVLLEPAVEYDRGNWVRVTNSWTNLPDGENQANPAFTPIAPDSDRPAWWIKDGDEAWNHFVAPLKEARKRAQMKEAQAKVKATNNGEGSVKGASKRKGKGKDTINVKAGARSGPSTVHKRKYMSAVDNAKAPRMRKRKKVDYAEISSPPSSAIPSSPIQSMSAPLEGQGGKPTVQKQGQVECIDLTSSPSSSVPSSPIIPKSNRQDDESSASSTAKAHARPGQQAAKMRVQKEADGITPGPATQEACTLPALSESRSPRADRDDITGQGGDNREAGVMTPPLLSPDHESPSSESPLMQPQKKGQHDSTPSTRTHGNQGDETEFMSKVAVSSPKSPPHEEIQDLTIARQSPKPALVQSKVLVPDTAPPSPRDVVASTPISFADVPALVAIADCIQEAEPAKSSPVPGVDSPRLAHHLPVMENEGTDLDNRSSRCYPVAGHSK